LIRVDVEILAPRFVPSSSALLSSGSDDVGRGNIGIAGDTETPRNVGSSSKFWLQVVLSYGQWVKTTLRLEVENTPGFEKNDVRLPDGAKLA